MDNNNIDLTNTFSLKTAIIESECIIRFLKLILEGPKYLVPRIEEMEKRSLHILTNVPEKLLQVEASFTILFTTIFGKQV